MRLNRKRSVKAAPLLAAILFLQACASNFATEFRIIIAASAPLVSSLPLGDKKAAVAADFTELAGDAATMADEFKVCGAAKPCKLDAVLKLEGEFEVIDARGHFGLHPRLKTVEGILKGLIASAKIFYGGKTVGTMESAAKPVTEADLKAQLKALKVAMQP